MQGYPKFVNSISDIEYLLAEFPGDPRNRQFLQSLLDERFGWYPVAELADGDPGENDITHKVEEIELEPGVSARWQYEQRENPTARIFRLGLTVAQVENQLMEMSL